MNGGEAVKDRAKGPLIRFVIVFILLIGVFYAFYVPISQTPAYQSFLAMFAQATGAILSIMGQDVTVIGVDVESSLFHMQIVPGCDGMEAMALFVSAVLASPVSLRLRIWFMLPGILGVLLVDLVRLVSLFYIGTNWPAALHVMHWDIWPGLLIVIVLSSWLVWARWVWHRQQRVADVQT
jgi:exosortase/archaeosortase family protein